MPLIEKNEPIKKVFSKPTISAKTPPIIGPIKAVNLKPPANIAITRPLKSKLYLSDIYNMRPTKNSALIKPCIKAKDKNKIGELTNPYSMNKINNKKEATVIAILLPIRETRNPAGMSNNIIPNPFNPSTAAACEAEPPASRTARGNIKKEE